MDEMALVYHVDGRITVLPGMLRLTGAVSVLARIVGEKHAEGCWKFLRERLGEGAPGVLVQPCVDGWAACTSPPPWEVYQ